jgi:predicted kinase
MIIVVFGLPGTGKSFFARQLQKKLNASYFNTDIIRDELGRKGHYDKNSKKLIYERLAEKTSEEVVKGAGVIIDGTFHKRELRDDFRQIAAKLDQKIYLVEVKASEQTVKKRLNEKREYSEADYKVYRQIKSEFEPEEEPHLILWTDRDDINKLIMRTKEYIYGH